MPPIAPTPEQIKEWFVDVPKPDPYTYEFAMVLGGTASAGAYTAGVVDFIVEALDEWTTRRDATPADPTVPPHKTILKLVTGTSGGGVNAGILSRALAFNFPHVRQSTDPASTNTGNPFYDTWVNNLPLSGFLTTTDIDKGNFISLFNGQTIIDAASGALNFATATWQPRSWLGSPLRLILTLTNLRGIPYQTKFSGGALSETFIDHADFARFALLYPGKPFVEPRPDEFVLGFGTDAYPQATNWTTFAKFAMGTAAFPLGFPPLALDRPMEHLSWRVTTMPGDGSPQYPAMVQARTPDWAMLSDDTGNLPADYKFLVVDGGVTDNEPIELARTALGGMLARNPRDPRQAYRGVLLVDPFAGQQSLGPSILGNDPTKPNEVTGFFGLPGPIIGSFLDQTQYDSSDLMLAMDDSVYSRFMITATKPGATGGQAIASGGADAFMGFACRDFMRYDYLLGRANAYDFLKNEFVLSPDNPVFDRWPATLKMNTDYRITDPGTGESFLPIIPLMGNARVRETLDNWPQKKLDPEKYRDAIEGRFDAIVKFEGAGGLLSGIAAWAVAHLGQASIADLVINAMKKALTDWKLD